MLIYLIHLILVGKNSKLKRLKRNALPIKCLPRTPQHGTFTKIKIKEICKRNLFFNSRCLYFFILDKNIFSKYEYKFCAIIERMNKNSLYYNKYLNLIIIKQLWNN